MSTPYYYAFIPLAKDADITTEALVSRLAARLPEYQVTCQDDRVSVAQGNWLLTVALSTEDWIKPEANEIADTGRISTNYANPQNASNY